MLYSIITSVSILLFQSTKTKTISKIGTLLCTEAYFGLILVMGKNLNTARNSFALDEHVPPIFA